MVLKRVKQKQISFGYCDIQTGQRVYPPPPVGEMTDLLPEQLPPDQRPPPYHEYPGSDMKFRLSCSPPLGQSTTVSRHTHSVKFRAYLETTSSSSVSKKDPPQISLWHNHNGASDWSEAHLQTTSDLSDVLVIDKAKEGNSSGHWFTTELSGLPKHGHAVSFTIKFRFNSSEEWQWIKHTTGIPDGQLNYQASADFGKHSAYDIRHFWKDMSDDVKAEAKAPETDDTQLWELTCPVAAAKGQDSGYQHHQLGRVKDCSKWFGLVRIWSPWLAPRHGPGNEFKLDKDGVLLSFLRKDGLHVVVLGVSGIEDIVTTFLHDDKSNVIIKGRNDQETKGASRVLVAVAESFEVANAAVFYHARKVVAEHSSMTTNKEVAKLMDENVKPEWLEEWYDGLTYCTWNGLGQNLTADSIYQALDELKKHNINIGNLIIDDNWQSLSSGETQFKRGWSDFEANKAGFPDGMKATTAEIRKRHPNVKHIAVWHAILGYWGGVDPNGSIAANYKTVQVEKEPGVAEGVFTVVAAEDAARMYDDFYRFLLKSGVDSVKTDAQFFLDMLLHAPDRRKMMEEYQDAWTIAHLRHFSSRAISCMSQFPQALFHNQLPQNKPRLLVRNSDDFFPPVDASHPWHVFCNAHNSLLTQHLNALPDWDMFQTSHNWAAFHAAARCVSGGPIYFTDTPGEHDIKLLHQMTAQTPRGTTAILRPDIVGKAMDVYNSYDSPAILKIGTYVGRAQTGTGIIGVFNVTQQHLSEIIHLSSFPGTEKGDYIVSSFCTGEVSAPMSRSNPDNAFVHLSLPPRDCDILTAYALRPFTIHSKKLSVGVMGLLGKMTGSAAVTDCDMGIESNGRLKISVTLKALGSLGVWISDFESRDIERDFMILIFGKPIPVGCVGRNKLCEKVLEVDVERAWKESGDIPGWSNEISVDIFVG